MEGDSMKKQIYCFNNGGPIGLLSAIAIGEDGHVLAGHCCSHEAYMKHDLVITSLWKHELYDAHFGKDNWELIWIDKPKNDDRLNKAFELNKLLSKQDES